MNNPAGETNPEAGFLLIELLIAMLVMVISLVGLLGLYSYTLVAVTTSQDNLIAKQKAREALESIYTARNTHQLTFSAIANVSEGGIFLDGPQSLAEPGMDGLVGTADDGEIEMMELPGDDGYYGTPDDEFRPLTAFQREIIISSAGSADLKHIRIVVRYGTLRGLQRSFEVESYVSKYR